MIEEPLISVVTPCFEASAFLEDCIESVNSQTYGQVEHIVQDAESTDGTRKILERYEDSVDWVSEPDAGESDGLNRALQRASGDILIMLNADDQLLPHAASWAVQRFQEHPDAVCVYGDEIIIDRNGEPIGSFHGPKYDFQKILCVQEVIPAQAAFFKRSALESVGFYVDADLKRCPDFELWLRLGLVGPMVHVPGYVTKYRHHEGSVSQDVQAIPRIVRTKQQLITRFLERDDVPTRLKRIESRAHAGAAWWGAQQLLEEGEFMSAARLLSEALWRDPSESLIRLQKFCKAAAKHLGADTVRWRSN